MYMGPARQWTGHGESRDATSDSSVQCDQGVSRYRRAGPGTAGVFSHCYCRGVQTITAQLGLDCAGAETC